LNGSEKKLEYVKIGNFYTSQQFSNLQTTWKNVAIFPLSLVCCQCKWLAKYCVPHTDFM